MNILFLSTHFNAGGITSYILTLARGLKSQGHNVYVVTSGGNCEEELKNSSIEHITINMRTKCEFHPKVWMRLDQVQKIIKKKNIDIVHAQTRVTQVLAFFAARQTSRKFISTCHGFFKPRFSRRIFPCWGSRIIAISPAVKDHLINDFKVNVAQIDLIPNGIDTKKFHPLNEDRRKEIKARYGFKEKLIVGIIARLSDVKGHDVLIRAMDQIVQEIPEAHLAIVGQGKMEDQLKKTVEDLKLGAYVSFYPTTNESPLFLSLFDVFVMPSLQEGLGLSVLEAQACGLPVVASKVGGLVNLIEEGKTGFLVLPGDVDALAKAIRILFKDKKYARTIGQNARQFVEKHFDGKDMVAQTITCYRKVLE